MSKRDVGTLLRDMLEAGNSAVTGIAGETPTTLSFDRIRMLGLVKCIEII